MSDDFFSDEYDDESANEETPQNGPRGLREWGERQKARADSLEARLAAIETDSRKAKLADALKGAGAKRPEALDKWSSKIDPTEAGDFLTAVKAALGFEDEDAPTGVSEEEAAAVAALTGDPSGTAPVVTGDKAAAIAGIDNEADFWNAIRS